MANEIQLNVRMALQGANGHKVNVNPASGDTTYDQATAAVSACGVQNIGTSSELLDTGNLATANVGYLFMRNLDATNYVDYGLDDGGTIKAIGRMLAGEIALFKVKPSCDVRMQANTAAVDVEYAWLSR